MWSIGIYTGESPLDLTPAPGIVNPVLTRDSVTDVPAKFVADPFMLNVGGVWHMFFEVMNRETGLGQIGLATSETALDWDYQRIVLDEPFHLSYPCVFEWNHEYYMIPETYKPGTVRLYKANDFPGGWSFVSATIELQCADPSIFYFDHRWWMFVCATPHRHDSLRLYFADDLMGPWVEHPASPIVEDNARKARPAGRVLVLADRIIRFTQDCVPTYGNQVRAFEISELTTSRYFETEHPNSPILSPSGPGWNEGGMHHVDAHQLAARNWIACVDGLSGVE
jgi:hypothetical protein